MSSKAYDTALEEATKHHASSKTYSGRFLRPHKPFLMGLIAEHGITSALDYGCGKGEQYRWIDPADGKTLEESFGFEVRKFDPAWPPYAAKPADDERFDLVMCTHVLTAIPVEDLRAWFLEEVIGYGTKVVYFAEKIGLPKKKALSAPELRLVGWTKAEFLQIIDRVADQWPEGPNRMPTLYLSIAERTETGVVTERWCMAGPMEAWKLAWTSEAQG